jgi:hypothetical protein
MNWSLEAYPSKEGAKEAARKALGEQGDVLSVGHKLTLTVWHISDPKGAFLRAAFVVAERERGWQWSQVPAGTSVMIHDEEDTNR